MSAIMDHQGSSVMSIRGNQVHSMDGSGLELELETFQRQVTLRFLELAAVGNDDLLSLSWMRKLLDIFILCQDELRMIFFNHRAQVMKPPMDRIVSDFFERCVKALDLCNAVRDGIEQIKQWQRLLEIVLCALDQKRIIGEGQCRRAKKALADLANCLFDDKESSAYMALRNRSFGRNTTVKDLYQIHNHNSNYQHRSVGHFRSLSWSVSRNWSAAKQLQAIGNSLCPPKSNDLVATSGLAMPVYTMSSVLLFVMWALVAAIPCQDRRLQLHILIPRQFPWSAPLLSLHERIMEDSKKRERKNACGLLREIQQIEKCVRVINELVDTLQFPLDEEKREVVRQRVQDLSHVLEALKDGLDPLERQVREVFHVIVRGRVGT